MLSSVTFPYGPLPLSSGLLGRDAGPRRHARGMDAARKDFIVLSEFSEQVGPDPVLVLPEKGEGSFNTSSFSVRIMSSDMQRSQSGGNFFFSEDTQVVLTEKVDGAYAYVHYFSLHDVNARGYVRQYAISYITSSMNKITDNFNDMLEKFSDVTRMLCCGNHKVFGKDIEHRLADLEHTKELLNEEGLGEDMETSNLYQGYDFGSENVPERDPTVVESGITEMKGMLDTLRRETGKEVNQRGQLYLESRRRSYLKLSTQFRPFTAPPARDAASFLAQTAQDQHGLTDSIHSDLSTSSETSGYQPQRVMAHYIHKFDRSLRSLPELTSKAYLIAMERLNQLYKHFSRSESALAMEKEERQFLDPRSSILTLGRVPVMNVLHNVMTMQSYLHETKPYLLCCRGVDPKQQLLPPASSMEDSPSQARPGFDTTFAEEMNALNRCPLYLNPVVGRPNESLFSFSDSFLSPLREDVEPAVNSRGEGHLLPSITRGAGEGGGGRGRGGMLRSSKSPQEGALQVQSSEDFQDGREASLGFHTPQEYRTPEKGNSPRVSAVVGPAEEGEGEDYTTQNIHPSQSSDLVHSQKGLSSGSEGLDVSDHAHLSASPVQRSSLDTTHSTATMSVPISTKSSKTGNERQVRPVSTETGKASASANRPPSFDGREPFFTPEDTNSTEMVREMKHSAEFHGEGGEYLNEGGQGAIGEEDTSAGCGRLEESFKSEVEGRDARPQVRGAPLLDEQSGLEVKGHHEAPPTSLQFGKQSDDQFYSPIKVFQRPPLQSVASIGSIPPEMFSPTSIASPEKAERWPTSVGLYCPSPLPMLCSVDLIEGDYKYKPGRGFLNFCKEHLATRDLIYCLLQGRTLVLLGDQSQENMIRRLVRVLWLFVPGHSSLHQVIPWQDSPLTPEDISRVKLVGLCQPKLAKHQALPDHVKRYVSYWDCTSFRVCTPSYQGDLLKPILSRTKDRKNETIFLTHIHSVLTDIAMQAYVYYHGHCVNNSKHMRRTSSEAAPVRHHKVREEPCKSRKQFLQQLGLKDSDIDIIEHFVSVIQQQQLAEHKAETHDRPANDPVCVRLSTKLCQESVCKPKKPY